MILLPYRSINPGDSCLCITLAVLLLIPSFAHAFESRNHATRNGQLQASSMIPFSQSQICLVASPRIHPNHALGLSAAGSEPVTANSNNNAIPIDGSLWPDRFPAQDHCSRCGLCETSFVSKVTDACAFLGEGMARMDSMEQKVHGRTRELADLAWSSTIEDSQTKDEGRFGVLQEPIQLAKGIETKAQWTGCVTGIALSLLESHMVDAVVCIANQDAPTDSDGWAVPEPILARTSQEVLRGRGVKVKYNTLNCQCLSSIVLHSSILTRIAGTSTEPEGVGRNQERSQDKKAAILWRRVRSTRYVEDGMTSCTLAN